jgi:predicted TIM-barrel fold metal-dependent hydrolase
MQKDDAATEAKAADKPEMEIDWVRVALLGVIVVLVVACYALYQNRQMVVLPAPIMDRDLEVARPDFKIVNAHDHLYMEKHLDNYFPAAEEMGIVRTLFVASSTYTFLGVGHESKVNEGNAWSSEEILRCAEKYPGKIIPFVTLHPDDPDKVALLEAYKERGAMGLKLYTGHGNFYDRALDAPDMLPVYEWCEANAFPLCWHVNLSRYPEEFTRVLLKYPKLKIIVPHIGQAFYTPEGREMEVIQKLMDLYPGIYVDLSFGTRNILVAGLERVSQHRDAFRAFIDKYEDRVLWGTDMVVTGNTEKTEAWIKSVLRACRDMLEKETYTFWMAAEGSGYEYPQTKNAYGVLRGLALPEAQLRKIYETNFDGFMALQP